MALGIIMLFCQIGWYSVDVFRFLSHSPLNGQMLLKNSEIFCRFSLRRVLFAYFCGSVSNFFVSQKLFNVLVIFIFSLKFMSSLIMLLVNFSIAAAKVQAGILINTLMTTLRQWFKQIKISPIIYSSVLHEFAIFNCFNCMLKLSV